MDSTGQRIAELHADAELAAARALVERSGLFFEPDYDTLVGAWEGNALVAVGARAGRVFKMLAVEPAQQGGSLLGQVFTALVNDGMAAGLVSFFVYTKPEYTTSFAALNGVLLASRAKVALLEFGGGFRRWLDAHRSLRRDGRNAAVVMNCNPFTLGHRYLAEQAAAAADHLFVFVVREDRSAFPFADRFRLVREGLADLANVSVLDTGDYQVSAATFPTYFLKRDDPVATIQAELDVELFAARIAPFFGIVRRFAGSEPNCALTARYNDAMRRVLPEHGIGFTEIERRTVDGAAISASRVRYLLANDGDGALQRLAGLLPAVTFDYLRADASAAVRRALRDNESKRAGDPA